MSIIKKCVAPAIGVVAAVASVGMTSSPAEAQISEAQTSEGQAQQPQGALPSAEHCYGGYFLDGITPKWRNCRSKESQLILVTWYNTSSPGPDMGHISLCVPPGDTNLIGATAVTGWPTTAGKIADDC